MYLLVISGLLSTSMVFAGVLNKANVQFGLQVDDQMVEQDVDLDYRGNYIKINAPAIDGKTPVTMIHQLTEHITQYRQAGHCLLLPINEDGFHGVLSSNMDDWLHELDEGHTLSTEELVLYNFTIGPYYIDREQIPLVLDAECDEIYPASLNNIMYGREAKRALDNAQTTFAGMVFGPESHGHHVDRDRDNHRFRREKFTAKAVAAIAAAAAGAGVTAGASIAATN